MKRALEEAECDLGEISFVHANGSGIPGEDIQEARSIARVFDGSKRIPVIASKSVVGHLVDAVGTAELALSLLALQRKLLPPIVNLKDPDPACDLNFVTRNPQATKGLGFLLHAFGLGGQSAALVISRREK